MDLIAIPRRLANLSPPRAFCALHGGIFLMTQRRARQSPQPPAPVRDLFRVGPAFIDLLRRGLDARLCVDVAAFVVERFLPLLSQLGLLEVESPRPSSRPAQWQDRPSPAIPCPSPPQSGSTREQSGMPARAPASHPSIGTAMYVSRQRPRSPSRVPA